MNAASASGESEDLKPTMNLTQLRWQLEVLPVRPGRDASPQKESNLTFR